MVGQVSRSRAKATAQQQQHASSPELGDSSLEFWQVDEPYLNWIVLTLTYNGIQ